MRRLLSIAFLLLSLAARGAVAPATDFTRTVGSTIGTDNGIDFYLTVSLSWSADPALYSVVQFTTNSGVNWDTDANGVKNPGTTNFIAKIPMAAFRQYRILATDGVNDAETWPTMDVWGEERPSTFRLATQSTNEVWVSFKDQSSSESGFLIQKATNSAFSGTVAAIAVASTNGSNVTVSVTGYELNTTYYFRMRATNDAYYTEWTSTLTATPAAPPGPPSSFTAYNSASGVAIGLNIGEGAADMWYFEASEDDTNNFIVWTNKSGQATYSLSDTTRTPGTTVYYRAMGSNSVGWSYSIIRKVVVAESIEGSVWYIDKAATGAGNGTNWANAWPNFSSIAWQNLEPGALVWIAPGNYDEIVYVNASGSEGSPITFKLATTNAPGAQGIARLHAWVHQTGANTDIHLDGARSDTFIPVVLSDITNNCGIQFKDGETAARAIYTHVTGTQIKWVEVTGVYTNSTEFGESSVTGIFLTGGTARDTEIAYCWVHDITGDSRSGADGFAFNGYTATAGVFGQLKFHHCIFQRLSDNVATGGATGADIYNNWFLDWVGPEPTAGHPDGLQFGFDHTRIYNNVFRDLNGYAIYEEYGATNVSDVYIYNNVFYGSGALTDGSTVFPKTAFFGSTEPNQGHSIGVIVATNFVFFNNTFYGHSGSYMGNNRRATECDDLLLRDWWAFNNLAVTHDVTGQFGIGYSVDGTTGGTNYSTDDIFVGYNSVSGSNTIYSWKDTSYATAAQFDAALGYNANSNTVPVFTDAASTDFHLLNQTNLVGTNLIAWESIMPGISRNADGTLRSATGWPKGALATDQGAGLVLWLDFSDYYDTNDVFDATQFGHTATVGYGQSSNWPVRIAGTNNMTALQVTNKQYLAITNWSLLENMTNGTVAVWARYYEYASGDSVILSFSVADGANGWHLGRDDSFFNTRMWVYTDAGAKTNVISFPDNASGVDSGWHHYAVTWSGNTFVGYYDGAPIQTNSAVAVSFLTPQNINHWAAVGCYTHNGTPDFLDDEGTGGIYGCPGYPNNGWLNGAMSDVRIYNRTLGADDVASVFAGLGTTGGDEELPPDEPPATSGTATATRIYVGTLRRP